MKATFLAAGLRERRGLSTLIPQLQIHPLPRFVLWRLASSWRLAPAPRLACRPAACLFTTALLWCLASPAEPCFARRLRLASLASTSRRLAPPATRWLRLTLPAAAAEPCSPAVGPSSSGSLLCPTPGGKIIAW